MVLYTIVPHKSYYAITFRDVPDHYILGGYCLACAHVGPVNRFVVERRWSKDECLRLVDDYLVCTACGNRHNNRFTVFGRRIRKDAPALPAGVADAP